MSKTGSAAKVKLNSFDDLFGTEQPQTGTEQVQEIALSELHEFKGHPFKVLDDEKMQETVESVREHGVLMPGIARPMKDGGYEIIAGHRRRHACELVGLTTMPMFIRDYTDDEATIIMVDSNIQREDILPSEKAKAYRMKYDAMKHQGSKEGGLTLGELGEAAGESAKTVQRYIWISRLSDSLLDMVDAKKIGILYTTSEVNSASTLAEYKEKAADYGFEIVESGDSSPADIPLAADSLLEQVDCLNNLTDNTVVASLPLILSKANAKNIPVFGSEIEQVKIGCLAAMGLDYVDLGKQTGRMAAEVLKGEKKASELNFEVIETAAFYGNSKVAEDLGITFPEDLASNAKELFTEITQ